jgi:hypothetical protein
VTAPPRPTSALDAVTDLLGLRPPGPGVEGAELGVVAGRSGPRFLVPLDAPDALGPSCLAYLGLRDLRTRITRGAVGVALRAGGGRGIVRDVLVADTGAGSLLALLADLLVRPGDEPGVAVAVGLPRIDDVWKPTLQVFHPDGEPAAFVKVGLGPVGARLVEAEAAALAAWERAPDPRLVVPHLLAATRWRDLPLVVVAPLPLDARRLPPGPVSARPVRALDGEPQRRALGDAPWWTARRAAEASGTPVGDLLASIEDRHRGDERAWARWHGDWVPWNLGRCRQGLIAWDWEYSEPEAPVGLDEVHGAYQRVRVGAGRPIRDGLEAARAEAERVASDPDDAAWLADAHLAMLVTRSTELERLSGRTPFDRAELLAAADARPR